MSDLTGFSSSKTLAQKYNYSRKDSVNRFARGHGVTKKTVRGLTYYNEQEFAAAVVNSKKTNLVSLSILSGEDENKGQIIKWLNEQPLSVGELSRRLDKSRETIVKILKTIHDEGIDVKYDDVSRQASISKIPFQFKEPLAIEPFYRNRIKIGCISDTHLGSIHQQVTLLHTAYKIFDEEKVDFITHSGDLCEGFGMHADQVFETFKHGYDDVVDYVINNYPTSKRKLTTYCIGGSHDMSYKKKAGANIIRKICENRTDLVYRGEESATFSLAGKEWFTIDLLHPTGGGAYSLSYRIQKKTEALVASAMSLVRSYLLSGEKEILKFPMLLLVGHFHQATYLPRYIGVDSILLPCLQSQTSYLKRKSLFPQVGFLIITVEFDDNKNVTRVLPDFRFFDAYVKDGDY